MKAYHFEMRILQTCNTKQFLYTVIQIDELLKITENFGSTRRILMLVHNTIR